MIKLAYKLAQSGLVVGATANEATGVVTNVTGASSQEMLIGVIVMALVELASRWLAKRFAA